MRKLTRGGAGRAGWPGPGSPTVFRHGEYRCHVFSREEPRMHVHVRHATGEGKIWIEPRVEIAQNDALSGPRLAAVVRLAEEHEDEIRRAGSSHFRR